MKTINFILLVFILYLVWHIDDMVDTLNYNDQAIVNKIESRIDNICVK